MGFGVFLWSQLRLNFLCGYYMHRSWAPREFFWDMTVRTYCCMWKILLPVVLNRKRFFLFQNMLKNLKEQSPIKTHHTITLQCARTECEIWGLKINSFLDRQVCWAYKEVECIEIQIHNTKLGFHVIYWVHLLPFLLLFWIFLLLSFKRNTVQQIHQRPLFTDSVYCFHNGWTQQIMNWLLSFSKWLMNHWCWLREKEIPLVSAVLQVSNRFHNYFHSFLLFLPYLLLLEYYLQKTQASDHFSCVKCFSLYLSDVYWQKAHIRKNQHYLQISWGLRRMRNYQ